MPSASVIDQRRQKLFNLFATSDAVILFTLPLTGRTNSGPSEAGFRFSSSLTASTTRLLTSILCGVGPCLTVFEINTSMVCIPAGACSMQPLSIVTTSLALSPVWLRMIIKDLFIVSSSMRAHSRTRSMVSSGITLVFLWGGSPFGHSGRAFTAAMLTLSGTSQPRNWPILMISSATWRT